MMNFEGIDDSCKPSSKVLRPPGGGSSDIFGTDIPQTPRAVKNHQVSNIFSTDKDSTVKNNGDNPRRAHKNVDSYSRLFGEPDRPFTPAKNHMKSNLGFGSNTEAAQQLLSNGNGHHSHTNGKGGSVSTSASSSVTSSTENLKMNGISKTVFRNMSSRSSSSILPNDFFETCPTFECCNGIPRIPLAYNEPDLACKVTPIPTPEEPSSRKSLSFDASSIDFSIESLPDNIISDNKADKCSFDKINQTRLEIGTNTPYCWSLSEGFPFYVYEPPSFACEHQIYKVPINPLGDWMRKPMRLRNTVGGIPLSKLPCHCGKLFCHCDGAGDNNSMPPMNGANQVIMKNRIPPGGFSSGLW